MTGIEAIRYLLTQRAELAQLVNTRIYFDRLPQGVQVETVGSSLVIERGPELRDFIHRQASGRVEGSATINILSPRYLTPEDVAVEIRQAIHGYRGTVTIDSASLRFRRVHMSDSEPIPIQPPEARDLSPVHGIRADLAYVFRETVPTF